MLRVHLTVSEENTVNVRAQASEELVGPGNRFLHEVLREAVKLIISSPTPDHIFQCFNLQFLAKHLSTPKPEEAEIESPAERMSLTLVGNCKLSQL